MKKILQKQLTLFVFLLGMVGSALAQGNTSMVLVAETDFSCSSLDSTTNYASIDEVDGFGNSLIEPRLSTGLPLTKTTRSTAAKSDFLSKAQYAITSNPKKLDELRMLDEEGWGFVSSTAQGGKFLLSMEVNGLKKSSDYKVEIEYFVPLTADEIESSLYNVSLRAVVNPAPGNETGGASTQGSNQLPDYNILREGYTNTFVINQHSMNCMPISGDGILNLYISPEKGALGHAIMIKSIKVYGTVDTKIQGKKNVCLGGETITLSATTQFRKSIESSITWYKDSTKIAQTGSKITHQSGITPGKHTYYYTMEVPDGEGGTINIKSENFTVEDKLCCMDENGNPMSQKIIWQDDFGTFTSGTEYWTWDYTDLSNPKKVTHQTSGSDKWITDLPYNIPGAVYNGMKKGEAPRPEGWYRVVSFLSDQGGADLGWTAVAYDGTYPNKSKYALKKDGVSYFPDHTYQDTSAMGGMLQINMGCYQGDVIYQRVIRGIKEKKLTFRCYINTFSDTQRTPVAIYVRATEVDDSGQPVGTPYVSDVVEKLASNDPVSTDWKEVKVGFELTQHSNVLVEIITNVGDGIEGYDNAHGNDLLLDDIQLLACTEMKDPDTTIIKCTESARPVIYANGKDVKSIRLKSGESVTLTSNDVTTMDINGEPYTDFTMSWHKDDATSKALKTNKGVVADSLVVKWEDADKNGTTFILKVQDNTLNANGEKIDDCNSYDTIIVYADAAPETGTYCLDENGNPMSQKIIWQDDFGTFTSATEYWTWDYTDLSNPKKVTHQTSGRDKWITDLPYNIPGAVYNNETSGGYPRPEGWYRVVSFLSDQGGANLGWTAQAYDGTYPNKSKYALKKDGVSYFPDHTYEDTSAMGGMLMLNMGCYQGDVIYQRVIRSIKEKKLTFRCYINTFSNTYATPVAIYVRATEVDDSGQPVGTPYVSDVVEKLASNDPVSTDWKEVKVGFELTQHSNVLVEIITNVGDGIEGYDNAHGNDLLLDDIQLLACTEMKDPDTTIIKCTESARPVIYANGKDVKSIRLKSGESVTLTSNDVTTMDINGEPYTDFTMSWHKGNAESTSISKTVGVVANSLKVKWEDANQNGTTFILKVQDNVLNANGEKIDDCNSYDTIIVYADADTETENYCLDDNGNQTPQKLVWQDDFGTFTSGTEYWTWDYTDLKDPKKVTHRTTGGNKWITNLPYEIPGAVYNGMKKGEAPRPEGWYRVVSFLSDQGGADLGWTAVAYDGTYPNKSKYALKKDGVSYFPDHTYQDTSAMGGMLQINMGCYKGEVIYSRVISGLCEKTMVFKCFINTFSDSYGTPVSIYLRATEIDGSGQPVGTPFVSDPVEKLAINDRESAGWKEVRVAFELTRSGNVMLEIVSNNGDGPDGDENSQGNDLLLDDIQLFTCGTPDVNIYFDKNLSEKETVACEGESIGLYVDESEAIKSYYGNPYYVYQYSTTPDNSKSWKTIVTTEDNHCLVQHSSSDSLGQNEKVYYRCVTGTLSVLEDEISLYGYFRPNDPCGAFSISTPIERTVYCVTRVETQPAENIDEIVNVYTITGALVKSNVRRSKALNGLKKGSYYIVGHEKVLVDL